MSAPVAFSNTKLPDSPSARTALLGMCGGTVLRLQAENTAANLNACIYGGSCHQAAPGPFSYLVLQPHPTRGALKPA